MSQTNANEKVIAAFLSLGVMLGLFFLFHDLQTIGFSWDEYNDFFIALDFHKNRSFFSNTFEPTQARLSHLLAFAAFQLFSPTLLAFKMTFAMIGVLAGAATYIVARQWFSPMIAFWTLSAFILSPYTLASFRSGATAGDGLVILTWTLVLYAVGKWIQSLDHVRYGALSGVFVGLAIGAKSTGVLLLFLPLIALPIYLRPMDRRKFTNFMLGFFICSCIAMAVAFMANPLLLKGFAFNLGALRESVNQYEYYGEYFYLGKWGARPGLDYFAWLFATKFGVVLLAMAILGLTLETYHCVKYKVPPEPRILLSLLLVGFASCHFLRKFQNAHYYVGAIVPMLVIAASGIDYVSRRLKNQKQTLGAAILASLVLFEFALADVYIQPDFLRAGLQYGEFLQGVFQGPVVNHCQGEPLVIDDLNQLAMERGIEKVFVLGDCLPFLEGTGQYGPIRPKVSFEKLNEAELPNRPFLLTVDRGYVYFAVAQPIQAERIKFKNELFSTCAVIPQLYNHYSILDCG